jgi:hypothetical protein
MGRRSWIRKYWIGRNSWKERDGRKGRRGDGSNRV